MKNKGLYITFGIAGALGLLYFGIRLFKKKDDGSGNEETNETNPTDEQIKPDPTLIEAIKNGTAKGKKVYAKISDVNIRWSPEVNNGWADNIYQTVKDKNTYLGTIYYVQKSTDTNLINPNTNLPYNWIVLDLDPTLWKQLNDELGWYDPDKKFSRLKPCIPSATCRANYWVREDTIKL